jgi:FixJ family two-component response regulator
VVRITAQNHVALAVEAMKAAGERAWRSAADRDRSARRLAALTPRETEVAACSPANPTRTISRDRGVSLRTVETYRAEAMTGPARRALSDLVRKVTAARL